MNTDVFRLTNRSVTDVDRNYSRERGGGTVLALSVVIAAAIAFGLLAYFLDVVNGTRAAVALAEDAALAAAQHALDYAEAGACAAAAQLVEANGAHMTTCARSVSDFTVEIERNGVFAQASAGPQNPYR